MVIANSSQRGSSRRRLAPDPMRRRAGPEPHDLLLGMAPAHLPENAPAWVCAALKAGWPVVVRRAPADPARVAIGVRGLAREQRWAGWMPFEQCPCRIDLQLQTPAGGVALREWAEGRPRVLAKGSEAPLLLEDPWRIAEVEA